MVNLHIDLEKWYHVTSRLLFTCVAQFLSLYEFIYLFYGIVNNRFIGSVLVCICLLLRTHFSEYLFIGTMLMLLHIRYLFIRTMLMLLHIRYLFIGTMLMLLHIGTMLMLLYIGTMLMLLHIRYYVYIFH